MSKTFSKKNNSLDSFKKLILALIAILVFLIKWLRALENAAISHEISGFTQFLSHFSESNFIMYKDR